MHDLTIAPMSDAALAKIAVFEAALGALPQVEIQTEHLIHAGMYARTIKIPAGVGIAGVLIKIPTILIVSGHAAMHLDGKQIELKPYCVIKGSRHRKAAFVAISETFMTMVFPTNAKTVYDAEQEFTDEGDNLMSRKEAEKCQA